MNSQVVQQLCFGSWTHHTGRWDEPHRDLFRPWKIISSPLHRIYPWDKPGGNYPETRIKCEWRPCGGFKPAGKRGMGGCDGKKTLVRRTGPQRRALQPGEKLLTSRRSSQAQSSSPHSVLRQRRSGEGPGSRFGRWQRKHPACGSPEESDPPFPGCPSWRRTELPLSRQTRDGIISLSPCNHLHPRLYRGCLRLFRAHSSVLSLIDCQDTWEDWSAPPASTAAGRKRMISQFPTPTAWWWHSYEASCHLVFFFVVSINVLNFTFGKISCC